MRRDELLKGLGPIRWRMRLCRAARVAQASLGLALASALGWAIASFALPIEGLLAKLTGTALAVGIVPPIVAFLWPIRAIHAARAADGLGLQERALTALTMRGEGAMHRLQREDALRGLSTLDARALRPRAHKAELIASGALALLTSVMLLVPSPQQAELDKMLAFEKKMQQLAEAAEQRQQPEEDEQLGVRMPELRRIEKHLLDQIRSARSEREALKALDAAQREMDRLMKDASTASDSDAGGADGAQPNAAEQGADEQGAAGPGAAEPGGSPGEGTQAAGEQARAQGAQGTGQLSDGQPATATASLDELSSLLSQLRQGVNKAALAGQQSGGQGASGQGSQGQGQGQSQSEEGGSGAGAGTTNKDAGKGGDMTDKSGSGGSRPPERRVRQYESIYDPERIGGEEDVHKADGQLKEGDIARAQLGPGMGQFSGDVPYDRVIGDYAPQAAKAADDAAIAPGVRQWVRDYFDSLID